MSKVNSPFMKQPSRLRQLCKTIGLLWVVACGGPADKVTASDGGADGTMGGNTNSTAGRFGVGATSPAASGNRANGGTSGLAANQTSSQAGRFAMGAIGGTAGSPIPSGAGASSVAGGAPQASGGVATVSLGGASTGGVAIVDTAAGSSNPSTATGGMVTLSTAAGSANISTATLGGGNAGAAGSSTFSGVAGGGNAAAGTSAVSSTTAGSAGHEPGDGAVSFCGTFDELLAIQSRQSLDRLVINCLVINRKVEDTEKVLARSIEIRQEGVRYEGNFCINSASPNLWLKATESILVAAPINLSGQDGKPNAAFGAVCDGRGVPGGTVAFGAPVITIDSTIDVSGGDSKVSLVNGTPLPVDGADGGMVAAVASSSLTLTANATLKLLGGAGSAPAGTSSASEGIAGSLVLESPHMIDKSDDQWNQTGLNGCPYLTSDTVVDASLANATTGNWYLTPTASTKDYIEDIYSFYVETVPASVTLTLSSATQNVDLDLFLFEPIQGNIVRASTSPTNAESITVSLTQAGLYDVFVNLSSDSPSLTRADYTLAFDVP